MKRKVGRRKAGLFGTTAALGGFSILSNFGFVSSGNVKADGIEFFLKILMELYQTLFKRKSSDTDEAKKDVCAKKRLETRVEENIEGLKKLFEAIKKAENDIKLLKEKDTEMENKIEEVKRQMGNNEEERKKAIEGANKKFSGPKIDFDELGEKLKGIWLNSLEKFVNLELPESRSKYLPYYFDDDKSKAYFVNRVVAHLEKLERELGELTAERSNWKDEWLDEAGRTLSYVDDCLKDENAHNVQSFKEHCMLLSKKWESFFRVDARECKSFSELANKFKAYLKKKVQELKTGEDFFRIDKDIRIIKKEKEFIENDLLGGDFKKDMDNYYHWRNELSENNRKLRKRLDEIESEFRKKREDLEVELRKLKNDADVHRSKLKSCECEKNSLEDNFDQLKDEVLREIKDYNPKDKGEEMILNDFKEKLKRFSEDMQSLESKSDIEDTQSSESYILQV